MNAKDVEIAVEALENYGRHTLEIWRTLAYKGSVDRGTLDKLKDISDRAFELKDVVKQEIEIESRR